MKKIYKSLKKIILIILLIVTALNLSSIGRTSSYFSDRAQSNDNFFSVANLGFSLRDVANVSLTALFNWENVVPDKSETKSVIVEKNSDSIDFKYNINFVKTSGEDNLCQALQLEVKLNGVVQYKGDLNGFNLIPAATIGPSGQDDWSFILSLTDEDLSLRNKTCNFNFAFKAYQTESDGTWGFIDMHFLTNDVSTGSWETPVPPVSAGNVVINEVMWMGSTNSTADEWIELRNTTDHEIDIGQWILENVKGNSSDRTLMISAGRSISAHGYFLIANYPKTAAKSALNVDVDQVANLGLLNSANGNIILKTQNGVVIDQAKGDSWPAGRNSANKKSMERNDSPGDGLQVSNWHTCIDAGCNDTIFWDTEGSNYGTPKAANLSGEPKIELILSSDLTTLSFRVININNFRKISYELTYDTDLSPQGIIGESILDNQNEYTKDNIILGTCSTGGACVYHGGIKDVMLKVILEDGGENAAFFDVKVFR